MSLSLYKESVCKVSPALILIPDISGFTEYMSVADLSHSQNRIASLLEAILESNILGLNVSEIEGDAILFYKHNDTSTADRIIEQCKLMFTRFHNKLKEFEVSNCSCGSCQILHKLSLKFIIHHGLLGSVMVKNFCKLYGKDLIIAHRLLKNNIPEREYLLFTQSFAMQYKLSENVNQINWSELKSESENTSNLGRIEIHYVDLNPIKVIINSGRMLLGKN